MFRLPGVSFIEVGGCRELAVFSKNALILHGASVVRVHRVREAREAAAIADAVLKVRSEG